MAAEPWRVAQIVVDRGPGRDGSRGSGYLVAPGQVLTAAHVVTGAAVVRVRLDVGQPTEIDVQADSWWADPSWPEGTDLAVVTILEGATEGREVERVGFGRIGDVSAVVPVQALGFPRFKLRSRSPGESGLEVFRDLEQTAGHAPVAANRRQGTLAFYLDDPLPAIPGPGDPSPWEGMSGAAVWAAGLVVGVLAEHHAVEGAGRLTARRIDSAYTRLPASDIRQLTRTLRLPTEARALPDVVPAGQGEFIQSAYLGQAREIAPDVLVGRDAELAEWAELCAVSDPYVWWQAGPWAGKTALSSWFVTHPPAGVDMVSFFITGRLSGSADSDAFLDAMIEQLSALVPASRRSATAEGARIGVWQSLLATAAQDAEARGRLLVVVIDGLDEDNAGAVPLRGRPSVASLLPRKPPRGVRFIITSRPAPGLPDDLPDPHPLRTCVPHALAAAPVTEDLERLARQELRDLFAQDRTAVDVVGFIAGSGGGLTAADLSALTRAAPYQLEPILRGVFGRSLSARAFADSGGANAGPAEQMYLFAHETLRTTAEEQLGDKLARYRHKIHKWIESWRGVGWPDETPRYAIRGYPGLLVTVGDVARLSALARDPRRHAFLLRATGNDYTAVMEMRDVQRLITDQDSPDLQALIELAVYRHAMSVRGESIPSELPGVWARLGRFDHAEALARTLTDSYAQDKALSELAWVQTQVGNLDRAEGLARTITEGYTKDEALSEVAFEAARRGDLDRAEALVRAITSETLQVEALGVLVGVMVSTGATDRARAVARTITDPFHQAAGLARAAAELAHAGDMDQAEAIARSIVNHDPQDEEDEEWADAARRAVITLTRVAAQAGDIDRAMSFANIINDPYARAPAIGEVAAGIAQAGAVETAEALARTIPIPYTRDLALRHVAITIAQAGQADRAEALAQAIANKEVQQQTLCNLASALAAAGEPDRAEVLAGMITGPLIRAWVLTELAALAAQAGDADRVDRLAGTIISLCDQNEEALTELATAIARAGYADRAEAIVRVIADSQAREEAFGELAVAIAEAGDFSRAKALVREMASPYLREGGLEGLSSTIASAGDLHQAEVPSSTITSHKSHVEVLTKLAGIAVKAGDQDGAHRLAANAEALARRAIIKPGAVDEVLRALAIAVAQAGDLGRAGTLARTVTNTSTQRRLFHTLATLAVQVSDLDAAEALIHAIGHAGAEDQMLSGLAVAIAQAGDLDRAESTARAITSPKVQARTLGALATATAQAGDLDRAESTARAITSPEIRARTLGALATATAQAGDLDRTSRLLAEAEACARTATKPDTSVFTDLAIAAARAGIPEDAARLASHAETLASAITNRDRKAQALRELAVARARLGDFDGADATVRAIINSDSRAQALRELVAVSASAGDFTRAEDCAWAIAKDEIQVQVLADLANSAAKVGNLEQADRIICDAEGVARTITNRDGGAKALRELAALAASTIGLQRAEELVQAITNHEIRIQALADLAIAAAEAGDPNRADRVIGEAEAIARAMIDPRSRALAFTRLATAAANAAPVRTRHLLAEAISTEPPRIRDWPEAAARLFPASIRGAGGAFLDAYR